MSSARSVPSIRTALPLATMLAVLLLPGIASGAPAARPAGYASPQSLVLNLMAFPADAGDTVYFYRGTPKAYVSASYASFAGGWIPAVNATPAVGEGFWASKATAATWTRNFSVNTP